MAHLPPTPRFLILETSENPGLVALAEGTAVKGSRRLEETRRHARDLAPAVADLLGELGWRPTDVHAVLVSRGPGSYTGLRVGIMAAKAFAYATNCGLLAIDTFEAIANQAPSAVLQVDVVADAQQDQVYVQRFIRAASDSMFQPCSSLLIQPFSEWLLERDTHSWLMGPGLRDKLDRLPSGTLLVPQDEWSPRPETLLRIGLSRFVMGQKDDIWKVEPLYLRPSNAEEKWRKLREGKRVDQH